MDQCFDVIVVGGGIVGICAAIAMSQRNFSVALLDAGTLSTDISVIDSRVYAINLSSQALLQELGVWELLEFARISPYYHMHVWDEPSTAHIDFDANMIASNRLGSLIEESVLKHALSRHNSMNNITLFPNTKISAVDSQSQALILNDGLRSWRAKFTIIADGATSVMRQLLKIPITTWPYHQQSIVTRVRTEKSHQHTAYQVFNSTGSLAFLPLTDPYQCSIVWSVATKLADTLMNLCDEEFNWQISSTFASRLGFCTLQAPRQSYPLHMRHAKNYVGASWLLMGDAAHTIHPLAGFGLNLGLADLSAWLTQLGNNKISYKILGAYQRKRKYEVWQVIALMEGLKTIFNNSLLPISIFRERALRTCDRWLWLKQWLINQGSNL